MYSYFSLDSRHARSNRTVALGAPSTMLTQVLTSLFNRDLDRLQKEIELYSNENTIWHTEKGIANSAGNLCLHLIGNLNTYIGKELGSTGYVRNRELEFSQKDQKKMK